MLKQKQRRVQFEKLYLVTCILFVIFLTGGLFFIHYMMKQNEEETVRLLEEASNQNRMAIATQIKGDFQTLEGVAACIQHMAYPDFESLKPILDYINKENSFQRMGLVEPDGKAYFLDMNGEVYEEDLSQEEFFQKALEGEEVLSDTRLDPFSDKYINYYAFPIVKGEMKIGILCAINSAEVYRKIIDPPILNGQGFSSIIDRKGNFLILSMHKRTVNKYYRTLEDLGKYEENIQNRMLSKMHEGESFSFPFQTLENEKMLAVLDPVAVNDWYIFSAVPRNSLKGIYKKTMAGITAMIAVVFVAFLFLLRYIRSATENNRKSLELLAYTDAVTGARTHSKFVKDLEAVLEENNKQDKKDAFAVWYCDIKRFKFLNDMLGYETGDKVLKNLARIIESEMGKEPLFCRSSADNFVGYLAYHKKDELIHWFKRMVARLDEIQAKQFKNFPIEISMGIYCPDAGESRLAIDNMLNRANIAQKTIKQEIGSSYAFYDDEMRRRVLYDARLEAMMDKAMEEREFLLYFQPKVDIQHGNRITGAEALVRWNSREKGLISPGDFIPLFERNGFIIQLDRYMFENSCKWLSHYLQTVGRPLNIAVNVSRLGILQEDFVEYYAAVKNKYRIPDFLLELEFTESMILDDDILFRNTVLKLKEKGFVCSLDDFGAGYSSLNVLKNLPIDVLKLDMLFLKEGADTEREHIVITNIISMAKELNMKTISEGVETEKQVEFLRDAGCDIVQGYVFAKPMPCEEFKELLKERTDY